LIGSQSDVKHIADFVSHADRFFMPVGLDNSCDFRQSIYKCIFPSDFFERTFVDTDPLSGDGVLIFEPSDSKG